MRLLKLTIDSSLIMRTPAKITLRLITVMTQYSKAVRQSVLDKPTMEHKSTKTPDLFPVFVSVPIPVIYSKKLYMFLATALTAVSIIGVVGNYFNAILVSPQKVRSFIIRLHRKYYTIYNSLMQVNPNYA